VIEPRIPVESTLGRVAFYGSLLRQFPTQARIGVASRVRYARPCLIPGRLFDLGHYPGLVDGLGRVSGELYETADPDAIRCLDAFEEFDPLHVSRSQFVRRRVRLLEPAVDAWVYVYNRSIREMPLISSGSWLQHLRSRPARFGLGTRR
jgi:gamma-glutamylcyclotransferase (GGCT)/AIG2-like uncharacterized protein YtfP